ncbi:MAG: GPR endopeptidase [Cellulosilyticaceae bacterium]
MNEDAIKWTPRTDLALEIGIQLQEQGQAQLKDVSEDTYNIEGVNIMTDKHSSEHITTTYVHVENEKGSKIMGKPIGRYITIEALAMKENDPDAHKEIIHILSDEIRNLLPRKKKAHVMVVGLGNRFATPDKLGPDVSGKVLVTRHIKDQIPDNIEHSVGILSSLTPGVMGLTGIETCEIIKGVVKEVKPDCIIAIDALAARNVQRINSTIQITDTGIAPGAGIGNGRKILNEETVGCPVIAIGVPTVIDTATLVNDTVELLMERILKRADNKKVYNMLKEVSKQEKYDMFKEILEPQMGNLYVTTKDIDEIMNYLSNIIFNSINIAIHPGIELEDINKYSE